MEIRREGTTSIVLFDGDGRFGADEAIREGLFGIAAAEKFLVVDLSMLTDVAVEDLGFLAWVRKAHREKWGTHMHQFKVVVPHGKPRRKIELLHMEHILCTYRSLPEALAAIPGRRAAIVDPDDDMASAIEVMLETHGYEVVRYRRIDELPSGDNNENFDIVLTEVVFDGETKTDAVRLLRVALGAPVGVVTSLEVSRVEGAAFVHRKPVAPEALLASIKDTVDASIHGYYENLFDFVPIAMIVVDTAGKLVRCNRAWRTLFRVLPTTVIDRECVSYRAAVPETFPECGELLGKSLSFSVPDGEIERVLEWKTLEGDTRIRFGIAAVAAGSGTSHILVTAAPAADTGSRKEKRPGDAESDSAAHDVLFSLLEDVDRARQDLAAANERLRELDRLKSEFLSTVSHELRTPLAAIKGSVENMLDGFLGEVSLKQQRTLGVILRNTRRLGRLIENLLDLSRIEAGTFKFKKRRVDLRDPMRMALEEIQPVAQKSGIVLAYELPEQALELDSDADRIGQIVLNIVDNAIRFAKTRVSVKMECENRKWIQIVVEDDGPGIPPDQLDHIFERFVFVKRFADKAKTGIGLSIVRSLVEGHGGKVWAENREGEEGNGARFIVRLPRETETVDIEDRPRVAAERVVGA